VRSTGSARGAGAGVAASRAVPRRLAILACALLLAGCGSTTGRGPSTPGAHRVAPPPGARVVASMPGAHSAAPAPPRAAPRAAAGRLPLPAPVGAAQQVVTVVLPSERATHGVLQAWTRLGNGKWQPAAAPALAFVGSAGLTRQPREGWPATPIGSFPLTQAFGRLAAPWSRLPYVRTSAADWWISQPGPLYNTLQHCVAGCPFTQGAPNTQLSTVTPQYDYAIVIDYNRHPVVQGAGSGYFLHVTSGRPTNGCVSTSSDEVRFLLGWLDPARRPRILIGVG
jgi:L,D-peptidoglycan transpeptidase YkuD (ErfK/YbiS/YcfS/YnhG family)